MKTILGSGRHHYVARLSIFLIAVVLIAGLVGCGGGGGGIEYDLTITSTAGGSVTTPGEAGPYTYDEGEEVNLLATPDDCYRFVNWTGNVDTIDNVNAASTTIMMNDDYSITANFAARYVLTIDSTDGGKVTTPGEGTFTYDEGTDVDLVAEAEEGYHFVNWTGDVDTIADVSAGATTITMQGDYEITANFKEAAPNEYIIIAQLNLWYHGPGCYGGWEAYDCSGKRTTSLTPALGYTYDSADPAVIQQQIEWAVEYGVDAFSLTWTTPRGIPGSLEENIDDAFLKAPNLHNIRWCIFYDFVLRLQQTPGLDVDISQGIDFNDPDVYATLVSDFGHFAEKYFGHPQYLSVDGRPIIYIWATWNFKGGFAAAVQEARDSTAAHGYDVFIVGEEIRADTCDSTHVAVFDASSAFIPFLVPGMASWPSHVGEAAITVDGVFDRWRDSIQGLKVVGRDDFVNFQPALAPQFDNRLADPSNPIYVPARSKADVVAMAEVARKYAQPVGSNGDRLIWLNTWNCWQETTTIEPTAASGPKYPAANYQFDMLEVVAEVFGTETFFN